jgi:hypothetical protein
MASAPTYTGGGPGFGALAVTGAKLTLKVALNMVLNNRQLIDYVASRLYADETGLSDWAKLKPTDKAIWLQRVQSTIVALSGTVGL